MLSFWAWTWVSSKPVRFHGGLVSILDKIHLLHLQMDLNANWTSVGTGQTDGLQKIHFQCIKDFCNIEGDNFQSVDSASAIVFWVTGKCWAVMCVFLSKYHNLLNFIIPYCKNNCTITECFYYRLSIFSMPHIITDYWFPWDCSPQMIDVLWCWSSVECLVWTCSLQLIVLLVLLPATPGSWMWRFTSFFHSELHIPAVMH